MKNKKGFTLVEITMAVLILAAITLIAVPVIRTLLNNSHEKAYRINVNTVEEAAKSYHYMNPSLKEELDVNGFAFVTMGQLKEKGLIIEDIEDPRNDNQILDGYVKITKTGKQYTYQYIDNTPPLALNSPRLVTGMSPIKWNGSTWIDTTSNDPEWYDYESKEWANARTADGSMWVWIPRYIYKISSGWHTSTAGTIDIQFSKGTNDNWNSSIIGDIDTDSTSNASNNKWTSHPAFSFGDTELYGFWIAKFEATAAEGVENTTSGDNVTTKTVKVIANVQSWRNISIGNAFTVSRNMETNNAYGWGTSGTGIDTHMSKNIEWGAVSYLAKSIYGKGNEIWINPNSNYLTGCAGDSQGASSTTSCNQYNTTNGVNASTTGNVYGVYDMSGGSGEYMAAYVSNGNASLTTNGLSIINANSNYKDIYTADPSDSMLNNYALSINKKGDAIWEVSSNVVGEYSWYSDSTYFPFSVYPWVYRGNNPYYGGSTSGIFCLYDFNGSAYNNLGFRPVLLVGNGL
jgi:prepilin-type N-terminal cleavage/methylation domain-containing protein